MAYQTAEDLAQGIKKLTSEDLQTLVSLLSGDYTDKLASTMGTMVYCYNVSRAIIKNRDFSLREQANLFGDLSE
jgi:hypothetical protein